MVLPIPFTHSWGDTGVLWQENECFALGLGMELKSAGFTSGHQEGGISSYSPDVRKLMNIQSYANMKRRERGRYKVQAMYIDNVIDIDFFYNSIEAPIQVYSFFFLPESFPIIY